MTTLTPLANPTTFICFDCHKTKPINTDGGTGYARTKTGTLICYECCADHDRAQMKDDGRIALYLTVDKSGFNYVSNFPGTLKIPCGITTGRHNIAGKRYDVHFHFNGFMWRGVTYGDNTQICHCKQTKTRT